MKRLLDHCAAIDVHKKMVTVCARVVTADGELQELVAAMGSCRSW